MAMRARIFDDWTKSMLRQDNDAQILHIGCGLDSRCIRIDEPYTNWIDGDFPDSNRAVVILEGISMYLKNEHLNAFFKALSEKYKSLHILMDVYTVLGAKASKY